MIFLFQQCIKKVLKFCPNTSLYASSIHSKAVSSKREKAGWPDSVFMLILWNHKYLAADGL